MNAIATLKRIPEWFWMGLVGFVIVFAVDLLVSLVGLKMPQFIGISGHERLAHGLNILIIYGILLVPFHFMGWLASPEGEDTKDVLGYLFGKAGLVVLLGVAGGFIWWIAERVHVFLGR